MHTHVSFRVRKTLSHYSPGSTMLFPQVLANILLWLMQWELNFDPIVLQKWVSKGPEQSFIHPELAQSVVSSQCSPSSRIPFPHTGKHLRFDRLPNLKLAWSKKTLSSPSFVISIVQESLKLSELSLPSNGLWESQKWAIELLFISDPKSSNTRFWNCPNSS